MKTEHPSSAKVSSNGAWPPSPEGHVWLSPSGVIQHGDLHVRCGAAVPVAARDVGCTAGNPVIFEDHGFSHYARKTDRIGGLPSDELTAAQKRRLLSRASDVYFLLDMTSLTASTKSSGSFLNSLFRCAIAA